MGGNWIRCVLYINDGIMMTQGREEANMESKVVRESLEAAGLVVNEEKSCWEPSQEVVWLGFIWDMDKLQAIFVSRRKSWRI